MVELHLLCCYIGAQWMGFSGISIASSGRIPHTDCRYFGRLDLLSRHKDK